MESTEERRDDNSLKTKDQLLRARHMHKYMLAIIYWDEQIDQLDNEK